MLTHTTCTAYWAPASSSSVIVFFMKIRCSVVTVGGRKNQTAFAFLCATSIFANLFSYFINLFPLLHINQVVSRLSGATRCHEASSRMLPRAWRLPWCSGTTPLRWWCCTTPTAQPQWCGWPSRNAWPHCSCSLKPSCSPWRTASLTAAWAFGSATWSRGRCRAQIVEHERGANHVKPPSHSQTSVSTAVKDEWMRNYFILPSLFELHQVINEVNLEMKLQNEARRSC